MTGRHLQPSIPYRPIDWPNSPTGGPMLAGKGECSSASFHYLCLTFTHCRTSTTPAPLSTWCSAPSSARTSKQAFSATMTSFATPASSSTAPPTPPPNAQAALSAASAAPRTPRPRAASARPVRQGCTAQKHKQPALPVAASLALRGSTWRPRSRAPAVRVKTAQKAATGSFRVR